MTGKPKKEGQEPFEKSLEHLETIVRQLESGEKGLEDSLALFERGVGLAKQLTTRLQEAKHRVEVLTKEGKGQFKLEALDDEPESDN